MDSREALLLYPLIAKRPPATRVEYRNVNYALLGEAISRISGIEYRDYVTERILAPLGLDVAFSFSDSMRARAATGYIRRWDPMRLVLRLLFPDVVRKVYGSRVGRFIALREFNLCTASIGGLVGSVEGFAGFLQMQLAGGSGILTAESVRRMQTMVAQGAAGIESRVGTALGWKIGQASGHPFLNHEGGGPGFTSELRLYPDAGIGIALAMNLLHSPLTMRVAHRCCECILAEIEV